jgi:hypothetical protein
MGFKFNPLGPDFSATNPASGGGGGGGPAERYTATFNSTTSWGSASGGVYTITISAATHGKGTAPNVAVYENVGGVYELVALESVRVTLTGNVSLRVLETPDNRFAGLVLII